jgi:hypothetical protein
MECRRLGESNRCRVGCRNGVNKTVPVSHSGRDHGVEQLEVQRNESGTTKTSSQKVVEPAVRIEKSIKQKKAAKKHAPKASPVKLATSSKTVKLEPNNLSRKKAGAEKSPSRKTPVAEAASAMSSKREQAAKKRAATAGAIMKTVVKQKSGARQTKRPTGKE